MFKAMSCLQAVFRLGVLFLACCSLPSFVQCCDPGWFGSPECIYKCHCAHNACDDNGDCTRRSKCEKGWFGPACQYADLVYSTSTQSWLYDGNDATCNSVNSPEPVMVNLTEPFPFTWLRLHIRESGVLENFTVQFKNSSDSSNTVDCRNMRTATVDNRTLDIHCDLTVTVQQVILTGQGVKDLCSVYISGGRNVALKQNTIQTTTHRPRVSSNAVDGDNGGNIATCTHTTKNDSYPTWSVALSQGQIVNRYVLYNRVGCCQEQLSGFILTSFSENTEVFSYQDNDSNKTHASYTVTSAVRSTSPISSVNITATYRRTTDNASILTLCEVEIYGDADCQPGKFGRECEDTCNCAVGTEACFISTGGCSSGCAAGFYGENCSLPCSARRYGVGCKQTCSINCLDQLCNGVTGVCDNCPAGKYGRYCEKDCLVGTFGAKCRERCSDTCGGDGSCHYSTGDCSQGCQDGYTGPKCENACEYGKYGQDCNLNCSEFCIGSLTTDSRSPCDFISGVCLRGCKNGYEGFQCVDSTDIQVVSDSDLISGIGIGAGVALLIVTIVAIVYACRRRAGACLSGQQSRPTYDGLDMTRQDNHTYQDISISDSGYEPSNGVTIPTRSAADPPQRNTAQYENAYVIPYEYNREGEDGQCPYEEISQTDREVPKEGTENTAYCNC